MKINYIYSFILFISTIINITFSYYFWKNCKFKRGYTLSWILLCVSLYSFGYALEILNSNIEMVKLCLKIEYLGISFIPALWIILATEYKGYEHYLTKEITTVLFIISVITLVFSFTNDIHHLFYKSLTMDYSNDFPIVTLDKGIIYWVHISYVNISLLYGNILCFNMFIQSSNVFRKQMLSLLVGSDLVWIGVIIYLSGNSPYGLDLNPLSFSLMAIVVVWGTFKYRLLNLMPIALEKVFKSMQEGVIVLDMENYIIDFNNAAKNTIKELDKSKIGMSIFDIVEKKNSLLEGLEACKKDNKPVCVQIGLNYYNLLMSNIYNKRSITIGRILLFNDITEQHKLMMKLNRLANIDSLTQLYNRRRFIELCQCEIGKSKSNHCVSSFIIVDIDYFKKVNDTFGHIVGDYILQQIAKICREGINSMGIVGRYGGEEFAIFLPKILSNEAVNIAEKLRKKISSTIFTFQENNINITASFGVSELNLTEEENLVEFFIKADKALYIAKSEGRNKVALYKS